MSHSSRSVSPQAKSPHAFRTITEAADEIGVAAHVLRFWESRFSALRPMKRAGGRRLYRVDDMALLRGLKTLLHDDGYTIKGVQKLLKDNGVAWVREAGEGVPACSVTQPVPVETEQVAPTSPAASQPVSVTHDRPRPDSARLQAVLARLQAANRRIEDVLAA